VELALVCIGLNKREHALNVNKLNKN